MNHFKSALQSTFFAQWSIFLRVGVACSLLLFLVYSAGFKNILSVIRHLQLFPFLGVTVCLFFLFVLGAFNIWILLNSLTSVSFFPFLRMYSYSWIMSLITPGQAGDASIIVFMKKNNIPISLTSSAYLIDKIITLCLFLLISFYGTVHLLPEFRIKPQAVFITLVTALVVTVALLLMFRKVSIFNRIHLFIISVFENILLLKKKWHVAVANILLSIVKWLVVCLSFFLAFRTFGATVSWPDIGVIPIMSTLVGYVPVSVAGIGTVEVSAVYLFGKIGVAKAVVISSYLFLRVIQFLLAAMLLSFNQINKKY